MPNEVTNLKEVFIVNRWGLRLTLWYSTVKESIIRLAKMWTSWRHIFNIAFVFGACDVARQ